MARNYGIEGFCYWHYWFAGKRLLERPFIEVFVSGEPDFPFCLGWANQSWTGIWHGSPNRLLIEQTYPGRLDFRNHFETLVDAFDDDRYIKVDGKPLFIVFRPKELPDPKFFTDFWRELSLEHGLQGLYIMGVAESTWNRLINGFDSSIIDNPGVIFAKYKKHKNPIAYKFKNKIYFKHSSLPKIIDYSEIIEHALPDKTDNNYCHPCVIPNWDNTPRSGERGIVFHNSKPELFHRHLSGAIDYIRSFPPDKKLVFIKSWNEWAEGNYLEPDLRYGKSYLEAVKDSLTHDDKN